MVVAQTPSSVRDAPGFRPVLNTATLSSLGTSAALLATAYVSYGHSNSIVHTVIVATAYGLPAAILGQWAGRSANVHDRRWTIILTDVAQIVIWTGVALLDIAGLLDPWWLTLSSFLSGLAAAIQYPAWQEFEQALVPREQLGEAVAALSSRAAIARIVGAVGGGLVITWAGPTWMFLFNAATFVPLIIVIGRRLSHPQVQRPDPGRGGLGATVRYARTQPPVRLAMAVIAVITLLGVPIASLLPAVADELGEGAHVLGLVTAFYSLGGGLVAAVLHRLAKNRPRLRLLTPAIFACALSMLIIGLLGGLLGGLGRQIAVVALLVPIGLGLALAQAVLSTTLQLSSSAAMEGRMLSLYAAVVSLIAPIGGITLALISQATSVWVSVTISGVLLTVVAIVMSAIKPAQLATTEGPGGLATLRSHVLQLSRYAVGYVHPGQFQPHTEAAGQVGASAVKNHG